jgi:nucleoside-diphosphate-sugar epimerase
MSILSREDYQAIESIEDVAHLDWLLSAPTEAMVTALTQLDGDILILGVAGKMGPSLAWMARRAIDLSGATKEVIGVSRFGSGETRAWLERNRIKTIQCDLLDPSDVAELPEVRNVIYMAGRKFGSTGLESLTWATNAFVPGMVGARFREARIVVFSTGNVYGLTRVEAGGSRENDATCPVGEYAMSCLGRERLFEHFSLSYGTQVAILRINYAAELRYGVLLDLAHTVHSETPIDLSMSHFNTLWQADANAQAICALAHATSPPFVLNVTGPELLSVREVAARVGTTLGVSPRFIGEDGPESLLSNTEKSQGLFGMPRVDAERLIGWTTDWVVRGGVTLGKPTHFQVRDGQF